MPAPRSPASASASAPSPARSWAHTRITATAEQRRVLDSQATASIISALAGTGKTTTLCMKACNLLATLGDQKAAARILVLAYSRAGVTAIRDRMLQLHGAVPRSLEILTMEQLCEQLLREQGDPVEMLDDPVRRRFLILQAQQALRQELERSAGSDGLDDELFSHSVDVDAFLAFEALAKKKLLDQEAQASGLSLRAFCEDRDIDHALYRLYGQYERMRVGMNHEPRFYAEGDCTFELCRQLGELDWDQPFEGLQGRYSAVLFDELHDLDEGALTVLRALVRGDNGFFVGAGDFNQHIHEGSFSVFGGGMQHILACLPAGTEVFNIHTTRRFGADICAALNPLFGVEFAPVAGNSDAFLHLAYDSDEHCAQQLVELHAQIVNGWGALQEQKGPVARNGQTVPQNAQHSSLNVVLRNPQDSILLEWVFGHEGVHYGTQGLSPFYLRREVALALALMWALHGSEGDQPHADAGERHLTPGIVGAAIEGLLHYGRRAPRTDAVDTDLLAQGQFDTAVWAGLPGADEGQKLAATLHSSSARMRRFIAHGALAPNAPELTDACARIMALEPTDKAAVLADAGAFCQHPLVQRIFADAPIQDRERRACLASLESLGRLARQIPVAEFLGRLTLIATASIAMHEQGEPVSLRLLTVEACKGREFTFVAVPFVERGRFPGPAPQQEAYRERNMLYVATTRARAALWVLESAAKPVLPGPV
ncbi:UvrD-helicase domain-containing protein [Acidovorax sp. LjRoot194]|uniref:UvrD-helicase domain-containing protein n=1 Tax=Acidovorax sp. LjRoot194 TaxID=3342280 RepID=UPI003ECDACFE